MLLVCRSLKCSETRPECWFWTNRRLWSRRYWKLFMREGCKRENFTSVFFFFLLNEGEFYLDLLFVIQWSHLCCYLCDVRIMIFRDCLWNCFYPAKISNPIEGNVYLCFWCHLDMQVHMCNKLASRHVRVGLADPSDVPRCDICESGPGMQLLTAFFFLFLWATHCEFPLYAKRTGSKLNLQFQACIFFFFKTNLTRF